MKYVNDEDHVYFVHSYYAPILSTNEDWALTTTTYAGQDFISSIQKGNQFRAFYNSSFILFLCCFLTLYLFV